MPQATANPTDVVAPHVSHDALGVPARARACREVDCGLADAHEYEHDSMAVLARAIDLPFGHPARRRPRVFPPDGEAPSAPDQASNGRH